MMMNAENVCPAASVDKPEAAVKGNARVKSCAGYKENNSASARLFPAKSAYRKRAANTAPRMRVVSEMLAAVCVSVAVTAVTVPEADMRDKN